MQYIHKSVKYLNLCAVAIIKKVCTLIPFMLEANTTFFPWRYKHFFLKYDLVKFDQYFV